MGEAAVGILVGLFAAALRWIRGRKEDTVLSGYIDVIAGILLASCGMLEFQTMDGASVLTGYDLPQVKEVEGNWSNVTGTMSGSARFSSSA